MRKSTLICILAFLMDTANGMVGLCIPLLATSFGADYDDLGNIGAAGAASYAALCLVSGRLSERFGHRRTAAASVLCLVLLVVTYTRVDAVYQVLLIAVGVGAAMSAYWPTLQSWLSQGYNPRRLTRALGNFNISWGTGVMVGPALGGYFYAWGPSYPFLAAAGSQTCILLLILLASPRPKPEQVNASETGSSGERVFLKLAWIANFATIFASGTLRVIFPRFAVDLGMEAQGIGVLLSLIGGSQVISFLVVSRITSWHYRLSSLARAQLSGAAGLLLLVFGKGSAVFAVSMLIHGALVGVTFSQSLFYSLNNEVDQTRSPSLPPTPRSRRAGIHESIVGTGFLLGPFFGGYAAQYVGPRAPFLLSASVILTCLLLEYQVLRKARNE
ncbi:MAG: hypothetical protein CME26_02555 [Gemmatimonadetes bacterium]|nr:hypothetical protein [Gemmatimonadota bacterium]